VGLVWGAEVQQQEGENQFDLPGRQLHDSRTLIAGLLEVQGDSGPWAGFLGTSIDHYDDFGTHPTLYAGLSRWATPTLKLRASGGRGYRPPAFHELYFVPFFGNPSLVPEQGWSGDLGLDWEPDTSTRLSITGYYQRFDDLIQLTLAPNLSTLSLFVGENVPDARIWGFELEGSHSWGQGVTTGIDYSYTNSRDLDSGRVLPRRPYHQGRAYCEWQISAVPLTLGSELVYRGSHFDDSEALFRAGDAVYLNAQMSYKISPALQVYLRGENLTDDRTPEVFSFGARGASVFGGGWSYDIGNPGREAPASRDHPHRLDQACLPGISSTMSRVSRPLAIRGNLTLNLGVEYRGAGSLLRLLGLGGVPVPGPAAVGWSGADGRRRGDQEVVGDRQDPDLVADEGLDLRQGIDELLAGQTDRLAARPGPRGAADPMDIVLGVLGQVIVENVGHVGDVQAACGDVGRHQEREIALSETGDEPLAFSLRHIAGHEARLEPGPGQPLGDVFRGALGVDEDQGARLGERAQEVPEQGQLLAALYVIEPLADLVDRHLFRFDGDHLRVVHVLVGELVHAAGQGRGKQHGQALFRFRHAAQEIAQIADEPQIEHAVRLIDHRDLDGVQVQGPLFEVVDEPPGRSDQEIDAGQEHVALFLVIDASVHQTHTDTGELTECDGVLMDLDGQLTSRGDDDGTGRAGPALGSAGTVEEPLTSGQHERGGLAGAGLGLARDVLAGEEQRQGLSLNRSTVFEAGGVQALQKAWVEAERREGGAGEMCLIHGFL